MKEFKNKNVKSFSKINSNNNKKMISFKSYQDRGMVKWNGFYLSEHTAVIEKEEELEKSVVPKKEQMTGEKIQECINLAIRKNKPISIQKEEVDLEGRYGENFEGFISGYDETGLYVGSHHLRIDYDEIRFVEIISVIKWL